MSHGIAEIRACDIIFINVINKGIRDNSSYLCISFDIGGANLITCSVLVLFPENNRIRRFLIRNPFGIDFRSCLYCSFKYKFIAVSTGSICIPSAECIRVVSLAELRHLPGDLRIVRTVVRYKYRLCRSDGRSASFLQETQPGMLHCR